MQKRCSSAHLPRGVEHFCKGHGTVPLVCTYGLMTLSLSASFAFDLEHDADALLQFEVASLPGQRVVDAVTQVTSAQSLNRVPAQDDIGERIWIHAEGQVQVTYRAEVEFARAPSPLQPLSAMRPHRLPGEAVKYLLDSRYCHPAQFVAFTEQQFGDTQGRDQGGARVEAIRDWVQQHVAYTPGASASDTTATATFHSAQGICRDYAHLFITLVRASAIPARYVACYAPGVEPQDFHAVCEVFLANGEDASRGAWHLVDPTGMADLSRAAIIGVGRDAGDVSFLTSFGPMRFVSSEVRVEDPSRATQGDSPNSNEADALLD